LFGAIYDVSDPPVHLDKFRKHSFRFLLQRVLFQFCEFAAAAALLLCSCDKLTGAKPKRLKVGFAQIANEGPWRETNTKSIKDEARKRNIDLDFFESKDTSLTGGEQQEPQKEALRSFIKEKVDVIAFSPVVETGWNDVLNEAKAQGIPIILSDRGISESDESLVATFIGSDFTEEGRRAARWLVEAFEQSKEVVTILEVAGTPDAAPAIQRHRGFLEILSKAEHRGRLRIVQSVVANFNYDEAEKGTTTFLKNSAPKQINAVFAQSDAMAFGAIKALEKAGLNPGSQIKVVSVDATEEGCREIERGRLNCAVECKSRLGVPLFDAAEAAAKSMALPVRIIIGEGVYDRTNVAKCGHE
jgi:ABC-type sugar transport system substrate-binding protein